MTLFIVLAIYLFLDILGILLFAGENPKEKGLRHWSFRLYADGFMLISMVAMVSVRIINSDPETQWFKLFNSFEYILIFIIIGFIFMGELVILFRHNDLLHQTEWIEIKYGKEIIRRDEDLPATTSLLFGHILYIAGILSFVGFNVWTPFIIMKEAVNRCNMAIILSVAGYISILISVKGLRIANSLLKLLQDVGMGAMFTVLYTSFLN